MKTLFKKILCLAASMIVTISLCAVPISAASPKLNKTTLDLPIGYYFTLKVSNSGGDVQWSSQDSDIVSVKASGASAKITGKKTGTAYIYAKTGGKTLKCKVTVKRSFIKADNNDIEIAQGNNKKIVLTVKGSKKIILKCSDKNICTASWGKWNDDTISITIKAKSSGTAKISVYAKGYSQSTVETIKVKVKGSDGNNSISDMENEVIDLVNEERKAHGLSELTQDDTLTEIAEIRAEEISEKFSHMRPNGEKCFSLFTEKGVVNVYRAENIASKQKSAEEVMTSWMNSDGHKNNILNDNFKYIGVGCYEKNGTYYWVQSFSS